MSRKTQTAAEFVELIQSYTDTLDGEEAEKTCRKALKAYPNHVEVVETCANVCLEFDKCDEAQTLLRKAISLSPNDGHVKYFSLAQSCLADEALNLYKKGVEVLTALITSYTDLEGLEGPHQIKKEKKESLTRALSTAYSSMGELYMTELCDEETAEQSCTEYLAKGIEIDPKNPDAYQMMAKFKLIKLEVDDASKFMKKSVGFWLPQFEQIAQGLVTNDELENPISMEYATIISAVQILLDLELYDLAGTILECQLEVNEMDVYTWYLRGWCYYLQGDPDTRKHAKLYLKKAMEVHEMEPSSDTQMVQHVESLLAELTNVPDLESDEDNLSDILESSDDEEMEI